MKIQQTKENANKILATQCEECSYIEYIPNIDNVDAVLETLCAYSNNYFNNALQYLFIGVDKLQNQNNKTIPKLPIKGLEKNQIEIIKNILQSLRPFLCPSINFEIITNEFQCKEYLLILVKSQTGGPFMVSDKTYHECKLKAGIYVRIESDTRLCNASEQLNLFKKFSNYHFTSLANSDATFDDLDEDIIQEYIHNSTNKNVLNNLSKKETAQALNLIDKNDPTQTNIYNYAVLMFSKNPDTFIPYAYTEIILDLHGVKSRMESKIIKGPIWKQYRNIMDYIDYSVIRTLTIRTEGIAENRKVSNFPYVAVEELVANALVHNNYENNKAIQIYISKSQINIVNYNNPLPPLSIQDLNERSFFNERDTENREIRNMFKSLGYIESFGTGIGEAKRSLELNGSPSLYYKEFQQPVDITSVVIPVNEEFKKYDDDKETSNPSTTLENNVKDRIMNSDFSKTVKNNLIKLFSNLSSEVFGSSKIMNILKCSGTTATSYIAKLYNNLAIIKPVDGMGKAQYRFIL